MDIIRSKKLDDGVEVHFDNGWYYAHSIQRIGEPTDAPGKLQTMWGWINHLRGKRWWTPYLEEKFIREVTKHV
jgi:hypothetical protein